MDNLFQTLTGIQGVMGAALCNQQGECVAYQMPAPFEPILIQQIAGEVQSVLQMVRYLDDSKVTSFSAKLEEGYLFVRVFGDYIVLVIADNQINTSMLGVAYNVVGLKLAQSGPPPRTVAQGSAPGRPSAQHTAHTESSAEGFGAMTTSNPGGPIPPDAVGPVVVNELLRALARQVGPIARVMLKQETGKLGTSPTRLGASQLGTLLEALGARIPEPQKRSQFMEESRGVIARGR
jgi:hypothetical protein